MTTHPDTIGTVTVDGTIYEIDWPFVLDSDTEREDFAVIYRNDFMLAEFTPWNPSWQDGFTDADHVLDEARRFIEEGGLE